MGRSKVPAEIKNFIARCLPTVEHLKVFMTLQGSHDRFWSAAEIAAGLRLPADDAADILERLALDNFLDVKISDHLLYRFHPVTLEMQAIAHLAAAYYRRAPATLMKMVSDSDVPSGASG